MALHEIFLTSMKLSGLTLAVDTLEDKLISCFNEGKKCTKVNCFFKDLCSSYKTRKGKAKVNVKIFVLPSSIKWHYIDQ